MAAGRGRQDGSAEASVFRSASVTDKKFISAADVKLLACHVLKAVSSTARKPRRLLALDRSVEARRQLGTGLSVTLIVNFVVRRTHALGHRDGTTTRSG